MSGWQDIASAPRDGTRIDIWLPADGGGFRLADVYFDHKGRIIHRGLVGDLPRWPTHWREIPPAPESPQ
jgi:hypothetical protein